jgi:GT2 family glycosyltransferase
MKLPDITIITTVYSASDEFLKKLAKSVNEQDYSGKIRHILINDNVKRPRKIAGMEIINNERNLGLTATLNKGFKMAKTEIVVSLMDDCLPSSKDWLKTLIHPIITDSNVAATNSLVELPFEFWNKFDFFAKAMTEKEQRIAVTGLDEKGCAYRVSALKEFGYLDEKSFANGGEDADLTMKITKSRKWKIVRTKAKVYHLHYADTISRIKKEWQYAKLAALTCRKQFFKETWNFKLSIFLKEASFIFWIVSLILTDFKLILFSSFLEFLVANLRLPFQIRKLWKNPRILLLPFFNIFLYFLYVTGFSYSLIFKPRV